MFHMSRSLCIALLCVLAPVALYSQSLTTGTLSIRNGQPETISLSIPQTGVTGYKLLLPPTIGLAGQAMTISNITGTTASMSWTDASFWQLTGTAVTTGGTAPGQQYLGSNNAQDLVFAANADEAIRIVGQAGPTQGYIGLGTATPQAPVDIAGHLLLSNTGTATELRFAEPSASGTEYTAFRAAAQGANITYTLPPTAPIENGMVLTATTGGDLTWEKPLSRLPMGIFTPVQFAWQHVIPVGVGVIKPESVPVVTMMHAPNTVIGIAVTGRDIANGTISVETTVPMSAEDRIAWVIFNP